MTQLRIFSVKGSSTHQRQEKVPQLHIYASRDGEMLVVAKMNPHCLSLGKDDESLTKLGHVRVLPSLLA